MWERDNWGVCVCVHACVFHLEFYKGTAWRGKPEGLAAPFFGLQGTENDP